MIERLLAGDDALARDDLDVAERLFSQVATADPRNAIAVVGLARIAVRREQFDRARDLAGQALAIDPDEAAAERLLEALPAVGVPAGEAPSGKAPADEAPADEAPAVETRAAPQPHARRGLRAWFARLFRRG